MKRIVLVLGLLLLTSPGLATEPQAQLGVRLRVAIQLPSPGMELVGIPDLGGLVLFSAPQLSDNQLQLELLPLRPGRQTLPALSLRTPQRHVWQTEPIVIQVAEGLGEDTEPAPLKPFPTAPLAMPAKLPLIYLLLALAALAAGWRLHRTRAANPEMSLDTTPAARLKVLADRLRSLEQRGLKAPAGFRRQLEQLRFGPAPAAAAVIADCERVLLELERQSEGSS